MQLLSWLSFALLGAIVVAAKEPPKELLIETTHTPSECSNKAKTGDKIKVHYVRTR